MKVRMPAVAGVFYPDDRAGLREMVNGFTASPPEGFGHPKALIAPHAGYVYSGPIAGSVYALLAPLRDIVRRVVLVGPSHRVAFAGIAAPDAEAFDTPLGRVPVDGDAVRDLVEAGRVIRLDRAHRDEHALEVHLPFLQESLNDFRMIPLVAGQVDAEDMATVLEAAWGGPETLIVVSSDLSHYHPYEAACRMDRATADAIEHLAANEIAPEQACGCVAVQGLLQVARNRGLRARTVDLRNSGDTAGPKTEVVGYGGFVFA